MPPMTKEAVAELPEFKRLRVVLLDLAYELSCIKEAYELRREDLGIFEKPEVVWKNTVAHTSDVLTRRAAVAKLTQKERAALGV